jgi:hypothetical protein
VLEDLKHIFSPKEKNIHSLGFQPGVYNEKEITFLATFLPLPEKKATKTLGKIYFVID